jgi:hypothetical protein
VIDAKRFPVVVESSDVVGAGIVDNLLSTLMVGKLTYIMCLVVVEETTKTVYRFSMPREMAKQLVWYQFKEQWERMTAVVRASKSLDHFIQLMDITSL